MTHSPSGSEHAFKVIVGEAEYSANGAIASFSEVTSVAMSADFVGEAPEASGTYNGLVTIETEIYTPAN